MKISDRLIIYRHLIKQAPWVLLVLLFAGCKSGTGDKSREDGDLMTTRTLGLAYLEEFRLEEAEKQFLRFIDLAPGDKFGYANLGLTYLRMGKYPEAEEKLLKAASLDSTDADVKLILATVYKMNGEESRAVSTLEKTLSASPAHIKSLYEISEIFAGYTDTVSEIKREKYLSRLSEAAPGNLVPRLELTGLLIKSGDYDRAIGQLEAIRQQFPEFPVEAQGFYNKALSFLRKNDKKNALVQFTFFHNYMKVTPPYQAGIMDLKGPGGSLIGFPLITFDRKPLPESGDASIARSVRMTDATAQSGLSAEISKVPAKNIIVATADYDGDGDIDIYASSDGGAHILFNNNAGYFSNVEATAGLTHSGTETSAAFADYDNDGFLDLFITRNEGDILYRNSGNGSFVDVTSESGAGTTTGGKKALFFDADHDGDLDLFEICRDRNILFRNNADGTFREEGETAGLTLNNTSCTDAAFADFDDDGDIDLYVSGTSGLLYSNQRQSVYREVAKEAGASAKSKSVKAFDYNNDGYIDILVVTPEGRPLLLRNNGEGRFMTEDQSIITPAGYEVSDAAFLDYDNDGLTDLFFTGKSSKPGKSCMLFHNEGKGKFSDVSGILPDNSGPSTNAHAFDYNDDGDRDLLVATGDGELLLLRNDGGNANHFVKMKLVGLRAGSAKNNHFGIGAKVEMRAGDLYQTMVVTEPDICFGIGRRSFADVIRITWTNGVPQNIFLPAADQALIEAQTLKGSCPFLYTWDGQRYVFVKDILWRSGLGMPLGIMGGTTAYAFADASDDYLKIPGEMLRPVNGRYSLQVTSELWETIYLDRIKLVAVDHPDTTDIYVEEQFTPPPFPGMKIFHVVKKSAPVSASDHNGTDVLPFIIKKDDSYLSCFSTGKYQGITEMKDIILDPGDAGKKGELYLFMNGWIFPSDASINVAVSQSAGLKVLPPEIAVRNKKGEWVAIESPGFPMGKDKMVIVDLSGRFLTKDHRVRIRTNMQIYWDWIFFSESKSAAPIAISEAEPVAAGLHYRGFSESYRKGGRYGPHWFDYSRVSKDTRWRDLQGYYTRYGNVLPLLKSSDNKYIISNAGDETTIEFDQEDFPPVKPGWKRDFLINSIGWVKDGDINTAFGNTVLPLPFHGMKSYPPSPEDTYPADTGLIRYNKEYNTRYVSFSGYLNALRK